MPITKYEDMGGLERDVLKEVGSIGTGNAATALSGLLDTQIRMTVPEVEILGYDKAIEQVGSPEEIVAAVLVNMSGEMDGIMLFILKLDFVNEILQRVLGKKIRDYSEIGEFEISALVEIGNIMISSYINALSGFANMEVELSVPQIAVNMLGGILSVPMVEFGYETDKLMFINGQFKIEDKIYNSDLLMLPDIKSLNNLMTKLGLES